MAALALNSALCARANIASATIPKKLALKCAHFALKFKMPQKFFFNMKNIKIMKQVQSEKLLLFENKVTLNKLTPHI
jgi:hypothetical protein